MSRSAARRQGAIKLPGFISTRMIRLELQARVGRRASKMSRALQVNLHMAGVQVGNVRIIEEEKGLRRLAASRLDQLTDKSNDTLRSCELS